MQSQGMGSNWITIVLVTAVAIIAFLVMNNMATPASKATAPVLDSNAAQPHIQDAELPSPQQPDAGQQETGQ